MQPIHSFPITQEFVLDGACRCCNECDFEFDIYKEKDIQGNNRYTIECSCNNRNRCERLLNHLRDNDSNEQMNGVIKCQ